MHCEFLVKVAMVTARSPRAVTGTTTPLETWDGSSGLVLPAQCGCWNLGRASLGTAHWRGALHNVLSKWTRSGFSLVPPYLQGNHG